MKTNRSSLEVPFSSFPFRPVSLLQYLNQGGNSATQLSKGNDDRFDSSPQTKGPVLVYAAPLLGKRNQRTSPSARPRRQGSRGNAERRAGTGLATRCLSAPRLNWRFFKPPISSHSKLFFKLECRIRSEVLTGNYRPAQNNLNIIDPTVPFDY